MNRDQMMTIQRGEHTELCCMNSLATFVTFAISMYFLSLVLTTYI